MGDGQSTEATGDTWEDRENARKKLYGEGAFFLDSFYNIDKPFQRYFGIPNPNSASCVSSRNSKQNSAMRRWTRLASHRIQ